VAHVAIRREWVPQTTRDVPEGVQSEYTRDWTIGKQSSRVWRHVKSRIKWSRFYALAVPGLEMQVLFKINSTSYPSGLFLRRFMDPIRVLRISNRVSRIIENRVPRIRENWVPRIRENRVLRIGEIGSLESEKSGSYRSILGT